MPRLGVVQGLRDRIDRPSGNSRLLELLQPNGSRFFPYRAAHQPNDGATVRDASLISRETGIASPFGVATDIGEPRKLAVVSDGDDDRLVGGVERLIGHDIRMRVALTRRVLARDQRILGLV